MLLGVGIQESNDFPALGTCSEISGHQGSFAYYGLIGLKSFLLRMLVRLSARWLADETSRKKKSIQLGTGFFVVVLFPCFLVGLKRSLVRIRGHRLVWPLSP